MQRISVKLAIRRLRRGKIYTPANPPSISSSNIITHSQDQSHRCRQIITKDSKCLQALHWGTQVSMPITHTESAGSETTTTSYSLIRDNYQITLQMILHSNIWIRLYSIKDRSVKHLLMLTRDISPMDMMEEEHLSHRNRVKKNWSQERSQNERGSRALLSSIN